MKKNKNLDESIIEQDIDKSSSPNTGSSGSHLVKRIFSLYKNRVNDISIVIADPFARENIDIISIKDLIPSSSQHKV